MDDSDNERKQKAYPAMITIQGLAAAASGMIAGASNTTPFQGLLCRWASRMEIVPPIEALREEREKESGRGSERAIESAREGREERATSENIREISGGNKY